MSRAVKSSQPWFDVKAICIYKTVFMKLKTTDQITRRNELKIDVLGNRHLILYDIDIFYEN